MQHIIRSVMGFLAEARTLLIVLLTIVLGLGVVAVSRAGALLLIAMRHVSAFLMGNWRQLIVGTACLLVIWNGLGLTEIIGRLGEIPALTVLEPYPFEKNFVPTPEKKRGAIVYVHGLQGSRVDTWKNAGGETWMDLIRKDPEFDGYDQYAFGYGTKIAFDATRIEEAISSLRVKLDQDLKPYFHVVIIAHSLGGLVSREALVSSLAIERPGQTITFITLASPFQGSRLADALSALPIFRSQHIEVLRTASKFAQESGERWRKARERRGEAVYHAAAYETKALSGPDFVPLVVDPESARREADEFKAFKEDHSSICKPANVDADVFKWAKEIIRRRESALVVYPQLPAGANVVRTGKDVTVPGTFRRFEIGPGDIEVSTSIRIPESVDLLIKPGTKLRFTKGAIIESEGRIFAGILPEWFKETKGHLTDRVDRPEIPAEYVGLKYVTTAGRRTFSGVEDVVFDFSGSTDAERGGILLRGPGVNGSYFLNCKFTSGNGINIDWPNPKTNVVSHWKGAIKILDDKPRVGGAVLLGGCIDIDFRNCLFEGCSAYVGGALAAFDAKRVRVVACEFRNNASGFGGGAEFLQMSEVYHRGVRFLGNVTGATYAADPVAKGDDLACGGAVYNGYRSYFQCNYTEFEENRADYVGGALYLLDCCPEVFEDSQASICSNSQFVRNRALGKLLAAGVRAGGGVRVDGKSRVDFTKTKFDSNRRGLMDGDPIDDLYFVQFVQYGAVTNEVTETAKPVAPQPGAGQGAGACGDDGEAELRIHNSPMKNPKSFRKAERTAIDTIVIHHTSALNWDDKAFQAKHGERLRKFEKGLEKPLSPEERKFDWRYSKEIFEAYGVSSHYLITRAGDIHQLVPEECVAFHAGRSVMPAPDSRTGVNDFSIGIELIATHPDDDPDVRSGAIAAYTPEQMSSLVRLCASLLRKYPITIEKIVGHDQIASDRKRDPGPLFDWEGFRTRLKSAAN